MLGTQGGHSGKYCKDLIEKKEYIDVEWIKLAQNKIKCWDLVDTVMNFLVPKGEEISSLAEKNFSKIILLHYVVCKNEKP
jgi:hypothetical protein